VVAVCSGTSTLELALRALDVGPGHEVILPALTFQATASVVLAVGATPVFAYNRRMTNLTAAIGLGQVERSSELMTARRRVASAYDAALRGLPVTSRPVETWAKESVWLYSASRWSWARLLHMR